MGREAKGRAMRSGTMKFRIAIILLMTVLITSGCQERSIQAPSEPAVIIGNTTSTRQPAPTPTSSPVVSTPILTIAPSSEYLPATRIAELKQSADITLTDDGKTFTYLETQRFMIFLEDVAYPVKDLRCDPEGIIGYISNGSFRGPNNYPSMFEADHSGECHLQNKDFDVRIIVKPL